MLFFPLADAPARRSIAKSAHVKEPEDIRQSAKSAVERQHMTSLATRSWRGQQFFVHAGCRSLATDTYTHGHHASVVQQHAMRTAENSAGFLLPFLTATDHLLDVGCGPGTITAGLADRVARVTAVDADTGVLEQATAHCKGREDVIALLEASAYDLPFEDGTFDVAFCHQVLQHLSDPVAALREMARVTKPGGRVAARDAAYSTMRGAPACDRIERWREVYMATARANNAEPDAGLYLKQWAVEAGLDPGKIAYGNAVVTYSAADDAFRRAWGEAWATRTVESAFAAQAVAYGVATADELVVCAGGWRDWADDPHSVFFYVNGEVVGLVGS